MIRRHPNVFGTTLPDADGQPVTGWEEIKKIEKQGREWEESYLPGAFHEARELIDRSCCRKGIDTDQSDSSPESS